LNAVDEWVDTLDDSDIVAKVSHPWRNNLLASINQEGNGAYPKIRTSMAECRWSFRGFHPGLEMYSFMFYQEWSRIG
jgi:hypothetical protein